MVVVEAVITVRVEVTAPVPVISGEAGFRLQVAGLTAPEGPVTEQARATAPVNPLDGVSVMVEVLPLVAPASMLSAVGFTSRLNVGAGAAVTLTVTDVFTVILPLVPVTLTR
jgi:hypothetical protein